MNLRNIFLFSMMILPAFAQAQSVRCAQVHADLSIQHLRQELREKLRSNGHEIAVGILEKIEALDRGMIYGQKTPTWKDFETLQVIQASLKTFVDLVRISKGEAGVQEFYRELNLVEGKFGERFREERHLEIPVDIKYGPTDYGLRLAYRAEVEKLNRLLPINMRFAFKPLPVDKNKADFVQQGRDAVKVLEGIVLESLQKNADPTQQMTFEEYLRIFGEEPGLKEKIEFIENEKNTDFAMNRPESARWWVPKVGFQNQRVTGSSKGSMDPGYRDYVESTRGSGILEIYKTMDADLKQKYGLLLHSVAAGKAAPLSQATNYGSDTYTFKKAAVRDRLSITVGDSFGNVEGSSAFYGNRNLPEATNKHWHQHFMPWSLRSLLGPMIDVNSTSIVPGGNYGSNSTFTVGGKKYVHPGGYAYVEVQYWGPMTLREVEAFIFRGTPPSGDFLAALQAHQVKIFDARTGVYQEWTPPASAGEKQ